MLRALARWPARRIALLWTGLALLLTGLFVASKRQSDRMRADSEDRLGFSFDGGTQVRDSAAQDSLDALLFASLRAMARDSSRSPGELGPRLLQSPTTLDGVRRALDVPARLSPAQRDSLRFLTESTARAVAGPVLRGVSSAMSAAAPWLVAAVVLIYGLPLSLLALTIAWLVARHRYGAPAQAAA